MRRRILLALLLFSCCLNVFPQMFGDESLRKRYVINTSNINIVKNIVGDISTRWDMKRSNLNIYSRQELLYVMFSVWNKSEIIKYCAVFILDNKIYIDICDKLTINSKWFDNFPLYILHELDRSNITYEEVKN